MGQEIGECSQVDKQYSHRSLIYKEEIVFDPSKGRLAYFPFDLNGFCDSHLSLCEHWTSGMVCQQGTQTYRPQD